VIANLTTYNPAIACAGIPPEEVNFPVGGSPSGGFVCGIEVWRSGKLVGSTAITTSPPGGHASSVQESVPVSVKGNTFAGKPPDAHVDCHIP
jgi:hypothetical protein